MLCSSTPVVHSAPALMTKEFNAVGTFILCLVVVAIGADRSRFQIQQCLRLPPACFTGELIVVEWSLLLFAPHFLPSLHFGDSSSPGLVPTQLASPNRCNDRRPPMLYLDFSANLFLLKSLQLPQTTLSEAPSPPRCQYECLFLPLHKLDSSVLFLLFDKCISNAFSSAALDDNR